MLIQVKALCQPKL